MPLCLVHLLARLHLFHCTVMCLLFYDRESNFKFTHRFCLNIYLCFCNRSVLFVSTHEGSQKCVWKLVGKHQVLIRNFYWILTVLSVRHVYLLHLIFWHFSDEICSLEKLKALPGVTGLVGNGARVQTGADCRAHPLRQGGSLVQS